MPEIDQFNPKPVKTNPKGKNYSYKTKKERIKISKEINTLLTKAGQAIFALDKMIELQNRR